MISIVGSGKVGVSVAIQVVSREIDDITLIDIIKGLPQGEAADLRHMASALGANIRIEGSNDYGKMGGSDLIVVTAGFGRKPSQTRLDLLKQNAEIVGGVAREISKYARDSKVLVVTNPLDPMAYLTYRVTGFKRERVFGMGGVLDSARFADFIAQELNVAYESIQSMVIGEHGESMVPLPRYTTVNGVPLTSLLNRNQIDKIVENTRKVAIEVISLKGATTHGPGACAAKMIECVIEDKKTLLPASAHLEGEYGVRDLFVGAPIILGSGGVERIIELQVDEGEHDMFMKGVESLRDAAESLKPFISAR